MLRMTSCVPVLLLLLLIQCLGTTVNHYNSVVRCPELRRSETNLKLVLLLATDLTFSGPPSVGVNMTSSPPLHLRYAYLRHQKSILRERFLCRCVEMKVIPRGARLKFSLAARPSDSVTPAAIQQALDDASSNILVNMLKDSSKDRILKKQQLDNLRSSLAESHSKERVDIFIGDIRKEYQSTLAQLQKTHWDKLTRLSVEKAEGVTDFDTNTFQGSMTLKTRHFRPPSANEPVAAGVNQRESTRSKRLHRRRGRRKRKTQHSHNSLEGKQYVPTEEEKKRFDPIILVDGLKLTENQKAVARLPDGFCPTPKDPIDVSDQMIGSYAWAERMRWKQYHFRKAREEGREIQNGEFTKMPWYKPTEKTAPKGDAALECFLASCIRDFTNPQKRRRIKDNMTRGQRQGLAELKLLPQTHGAACRYADKTGTTVVTSIQDDERTILGTLNDSQQYDILDSDPVPETIKAVKDWTRKWTGCLQKDIADYVLQVEDSHPAKVKPLIKTHKPAPFPYRMLLSGSGTPIQPLSKVIQTAISHLTNHLPYQIIDTKAFLQKIERIKLHCTPLPPSACLAVCDVVALYPSVDNTMGVPAVKRMLTEHPSPTDIPNQCIVDALEIALNKNACSYVDTDGVTTYAAPNHGTAMGPCHAPDYVDVFMGELDEKLVHTSPVPLLSSVMAASDTVKTSDLDWSRYRDDGFAVLPDNSRVGEFEQHLQNLHPEGIQWTVSHGKDANYLDVRLHITDDGNLETDVFSKNSNSYLPPYSCHPPSVFKGLGVGVGRRLRMICSDDNNLEQRILEYAKYFTLSGWKWSRALHELRKGAAKPRHAILNNQTKKQKNKIAWVTKYDPRVPSKCAIINENIHMLYSNPDNKDIFPRKCIIAADRRRRNLGEIYKPTVPRLQSRDVQPEKKGFFPCNKKCDTCKHSEQVTEFRCPWDGRCWQVRDHITCDTKNVIYVLKCCVHPDVWYVGSTTNLKRRWGNHKSDIKLKKLTKCRMAHHVHNVEHPDDLTFSFLKIFPVERVHQEARLLEREIFWQANLGTLISGLNERQDWKAALKYRVQYRS